jgi:phosphatidylserine/phosphatidylglycerophosphate/cardiolipin synthase-like enzyme
MTLRRKRIFAVIIFFLCFNSFIFAARHKNTTDCIEFARQALQSKNKEILASFFVPNDPVKTVLRGLIQNEMNCIEAAQFRIIDKDIAHDLIAAAQRNVLVRLVIDYGCLLDQHEKASEIAKQGIAIRTFFGKSTLMHHKYWIFGKNFCNGPILVTGSANATRSGLTRNQENIIVLNNQGIIANYRAQFEALFSKTNPFNPLRPEPIIEESYMHQLGRNFAKVFKPAL